MGRKRKPQQHTLSVRISDDPPRLPRTRSRSHRQLQRRIGVSTSEVAKMLLELAKGERWMIGWKSPNSCDIRPRLSSGFVRNGNRSD